ncbi:GPW/gp25 family protein [Siccirubricoccus sp. G192]|uniref:GPW/gp25 family protein n=1 Tax=Siccirubricoccus sp. G192 TaxID=2849651 RepID=UPI001C2C433E|nr:GPW/gp25 family protein [Siccirubricoccus sp. G192]MBV1800625.1 GPW/gp25 family protein [Siccirubricoccus sp. G192]MBV1800690.1 GPW/gp25 family protein [Siccirubricoccus sp. G192]
MEDRKEFLGRGWAFPVAVDPETGRTAMAEHEADIRQAIRIILGTSPGERVMRPDFGCGVHDLVFESLDTAALARVEDSVRDALVRFEPRIELLQVAADALRAPEGELTVSIDYRVRRTNQSGNLVYPFYFREGAAS